MHVQSHTKHQNAMHHIVA